MGRYVIASGDFNSVPATLPMDIIRDHAGLIDAWVVTHPNTPEPTLSNPPSPQDAIRLHGITADSPLNSYSAGKPLEPLARKFQGKRLDYVFYRQPSSLHATARTPVLRAVRTRVVMTERVPRCPFSYSDHFGLESTFEIEGPKGSDLTDPNSIDIPAPTSPRHTVSFSISSQANPQPALSSRDVSNDSITQALISLTARYRYAQSQGRQQLFIFLVCLFVLIAIIATSAWFPFYINPVLYLITVLVAWLATTMLYVGFVYGNWEVNALTNIIEELELYRTSLEAGRRGRFGTP